MLFRSDLNVEALNFEFFEHDLAHLFTVLFGVLWSFSQKDVVFLWISTELVVEAVMPDFSDIVPVFDGTVFNWIAELQNTSLSLSFITNVNGLSVGTLHGDLVLGATNESWEDGTWGVITRETGLGHTSTVINNYSFTCSI